MNFSWPKIMIGYVAGAVALALFTVLFFIKPAESGSYTPLTAALSVLMVVSMLAGLVYWFMGVWRLHQNLAEATGGKYPVSPGKAVGFQFIPFYNVYWIFKWTGEVAAFVEAAEGRDVLGKNRQGWLLLGGGIVGRIISGAFQLISFAVLAHQCSAVRNAIEGKALPIDYSEHRYNSRTGVVVAWVMAVFLVIFVIAAIAVPNLMKSREEAKALDPSTTTSAVQPPPSQS